MNKYLVTLILIFFLQNSFAQEEKNTFSFDFNQTNLEKAIETIEKNTAYTFYLDTNWLKENPQSFTLNFTNASLEQILSQLFEKTNLNYFITNNKIILTKNSIIYNELPENYFTPEKTKSDSESATVFRTTPVFQKEHDDKDANDNTPAMIGRENKASDQKTFELSGYVRNQKTGKPASDVIIRVKNSEHSTVTDAEGFYSIKLPIGLNILETESFLFQKKTRKVILYSNGKMDFSVAENINQLNEVIVKAKKTETLKSATMGLTSLNVEALKNIPMVLGERDILKIATTIPGVKTAGEGSAGFNVRGGKTDQNLILLDNAVIYNPAHFFGFFSAINPFTTGSVDIYKGSIPAEHGGRLSSVFDITTKNGNTTKISGEGGIGAVTSNLTASIPVVKDKASVLVGARGTYSGWILRSLNEKSLKNSEASFYDAILKYNHKINDNNTIDATGYYSKDVFSVSSDSLYKYSNQLISLKWSHNFSPKHQGALLLSNSVYNFNIEYDKEKDRPKSFEFGYKIDEKQVQFKFNYALTDKHKLTYGVSGKHYKINPGYLSPTDDQSVLNPVYLETEKAFETGIYLADSYKVSDKLLINAGIRYSFYGALGNTSQRIYQEDAPIADESVVETRQYGNNEIIKTYGGFEPRLSVRYFINDELSIKAGYDKTYQYLHLLSSNTTQSPTDAWKLSDLNIKPQNADQFSIGLYKNFSQRDFEVSLEGYTKRINDILDYKVGANLLLNQNIETELLKGKGKAYGVEFLIKKQAGKLNGWLGYTYSRTFIKLDSKFESEKVNNNEYFPANYDKPHDISAVLNYKFTKRYSLSTNFTYQTGRPITYPIGKYTYGNAEYTLYSDRNQLRIPDYYRLDLGFNIEGNHKIKKLAHSFWNISVYNVLGRNNPYSVFFVTKNGEVKAYKTTIFSIPIPTVTYNFKF
ncbi:TonB-dependent receptor [Flavobacterium enshiense]|uniref:TonB-dependent receptor domain-containing protein n=1 Tax=Flavobacterium enshiense TaxID=1341165 RepID=UPI00345CBCD0